MKHNAIDIAAVTGDKSRRIARLFRAVESYGGALRFVGGCVRDALKGVESRDIDLATDLSPDEMVEACAEKSIRTVPVGIKFGTVGVLVDDSTVLEVTSLRKDISTDGRRAVVEFTSDWEEDAGRRDLTINALYADEKGTVYDYYDGLADLDRGIVRFIGDPGKRIEEDCLRILRFFRFYSIFGRGEPDAKALKACERHKEGLRKLSAERIRAEMEKILLSPNALATLELMDSRGIVGEILPAVKNLDALARLVKTVAESGIPGSALRRLFVLYRPDRGEAAGLAERLKFSKAEKQEFVRWAEVETPLDDLLDERKRRGLAYRYGNRFVADKLLLALAVEDRRIDNLKEILNSVRAMEIPAFPLAGKDLLEAGIPAGGSLGKILRDLEGKFVASGFELTKEELLDMV